jgi:hypothetical protein
MQAQAVGLFARTGARIGSVPVLVNKAWNAGLPGSRSHSIHSAPLARELIDKKT